MADQPKRLDLDARRREAQKAPFAEIQLAGELFPIYRHNIGMQMLAAAQAENMIGMVAAILGDDRIGVSIFLSFDEIQDVMTLVNAEMGFDTPGEASASPATSLSITMPSRPISNDISV